jgi:2-polyprenyl-6-methoxyphenol hydroxylase-like FAD-dependent oxidoreductase
MFKSPLPGSRRISRQRLRKVLNQGIDVKWSKKVVQIEFPSDDTGNITEYESPVQLIFDDGDTAAADFVLAADGASSKIRELLLGPEAACVELAGFMFATGVTNYRDADKVAAVVKAHPVAAITLGTESVAGCGGMSIFQVSLTTKEQISFCLFMALTFLFTFKFYM